MQIKNRLLIVLSITVFVISALALNGSLLAKDTTAKHLASYSPTIAPGKQPLPSSEKTSSDWSDPVLLSGLQAKGYGSPGIMEDSRGVLYAWWSVTNPERVSKGGGFWVKNPGAGWSEPQEFSIPDSGVLNHISLFEGKLGVLYAIWLPYKSRRSQLTDILLSTNSGKGWSKPSVVISQAYKMPQLSYRQVISDSQGILHAVWAAKEKEQKDKPGCDIYYSFSNSGTIWSKPIKLNSDGSTLGYTQHYQPQLIEDSNGELHAIWIAAQDKPMMGDSDLLWARKDGKGWTPAAPIKPDAATDYDAELFLQLASDKTGNIYAAWLAVSRKKGGRAREGKWAVLFSMNSGEKWSTPEEVATVRVHDFMPVTPSIAVDGSGVVHVAWAAAGEKEATGDDAEVFWSMRTKEGWSKPLPVNTNATSDRLHEWLSYLFADSQGKLHIVWCTGIDDDASDWRIYYSIHQKKAQQ